MKKSISLLLVLVLILGMFAYISSEDKEDGAEDETLAVTIVVSSAFGDKSVNDSAKEGGEMLAAEDRFQVEYIECNNEKIKQHLMDAADDSDVVIAVGWQCYEISEVAPEYPKVKFILVDNAAEGIENIPNLLSITYAQNEGGFLAGYIAAEMSSAGVIGTVGGEETEAAKDYIHGFKQGAAYVNPEIQVVSVFTGNNDDPVAARQYGLELAETGADVVFNLTGNGSTGVFQAARESGMYAIGIETDQKLSCRDYDNLILCSVSRDIGQSVYDVICAYGQDDTWEGGKVLLTDMATGYISVVYGNENSMQVLDEELKAKVDEIRDMIVSGDIKVKTVR